MLNIVEHGVVLETSHLSHTPIHTHTHSHIPVYHCFKPVVTSPLNIHFYIHCSPFVSVYSPNAQCTTISLPPSSIGNAPMLIAVNHAVVPHILFSMLISMNISWSGVLCTFTRKRSHIHPNRLNLPNVGL